MSVVEFATDRFNRNQSTAAIFLKVRKVFDRVWHEGLVYKLQQMKVPAHITSTILFYLDERMLRVRIGTAHSTHRKIEVRIPQGLLLSLLLL